MMKLEYSVFCIVTLPANLGIPALQFLFIITFHISKISSQTLTPLLYNIVTILLEKLTKCAEPVYSNQT